MLTKYNAKKVYRYLIKRMFSLESINPKIRELLLDDKILTQLNKKLLPEQQIFKTKDLVFVKVNKVTKSEMDRIYFEFRRFAILKPLSDDEFNKNVNNGNINYGIKYDRRNSYFWPSKHNTIIHELYPNYCKKNDLYINAIIPLSMIYDYEFITLEGIQQLENKINKKENINTNING